MQLIPATAPTPLCYFVCSVIMLRSKMYKTLLGRSSGKKMKKINNNFTKKKELYVLPNDLLPWLRFSHSRGSAFVRICSTHIKLFIHFLFKFPSINRYYWNSSVIIVPGYCQKISVAERITKHHYKYTIRNNFCKRYITLLWYYSYRHDKKIINYINLRSGVNNQTYPYFGENQFFTDY